MMWFNIFKFEIVYRLKRADTYIFFIFLLLFSIVGVDFVFQGVEIGDVKKNSPLIISKTMGAITGIFMILASMIMGVAVLRDFEYNIESLLFTKPIKKRDYLLGRFLGSFAVLLFVFSGLLFGMILSEFMPWHNQKHYLDFSILPYFYSFATITLPTLFFGGCLFFISGALSRKLVVVYTQGVFLFVVFMLTKAITNDFWQAVLDPFSLTTLSLITESWSVLEKNSQLIPFNNVLLFNKLFWMILAILTLLFGYRKFSFNVLKTKRFNKKHQQKNTFKNDVLSAVQIPEIEIKKGFLSKLIQLKEFTWFYFISICKLPSFWGIVICGMIIILINSVNLGTVYGVDSYPATYFIVEELQETSGYFFIIIMLFYSGELIWKERSAKLNLIYDATPTSSFINLLGKYLGLNLIYIVLIFGLIFSGIIFQTLKGYDHYELQVYFYGFFFEVLPFLALNTLVAFFLQALINQKFVAIISVLIFFISITILEAFGFNHVLYLFGGDSLPKYSDMNGYGHYLKPYLIIKTYWFVFGFFLLILASLIIARGTETNFIKRLRTGRKRMSISLLKLSSTLLCLLIFLGSYIFYNTNILNEYWTDENATKFRVSYEQTLKKFEYLPQPKITDVNLKVELYPSQRSYVAEGFYMLKNTSDTNINEIHIQKKIESNLSLDVSLSRKAIKNNDYSKFDYVIYELKKPLKPNDTLKMKFQQSFISKGFESKNTNKNIVENGTFFNNKDFPTLGYNKKYELRDNEQRANFNLKLREYKADRNNINELLNARSGSDSNGIKLDIIIGTEKNQTAIAPGKRIKNWESNHRNYVHFITPKPIINFYAIVSACYQKKNQFWISKVDSLKKSVALEIFYHPKHRYNLDRMFASMKASLDYYSTNFSAYQYQHLRIMEFPRYAEFAQSFPGTIPFSESLGFVLDIDDENDVDMVFYITAHEIAHQWFGMQVEAANVKGQHFILETLSQYAAIMVLKQQYSDEKVQQFLELQLEKYKEGKKRKVGEESSLVLVENQDYIYYAKGAITMYQLQEMIGESKVNLALKRFIEDWNTTNGNLKTTTNRYATSKDLFGYFKKVTPNDLQQKLTELFINVEKLKLK